MAIYFRNDVAYFVRRSRCCVLLVGLCLVLGCQPVSPHSGRARVVNLPELCGLSLEELLMIDVVGQSNMARTGEAQALPRATVID